MIRRSRELYDDLREPRRIRLRRSSRHPEIEIQYIKKYNTEEHLLYRKQEISSVYQMYQYYKSQDEITYWLSKKCCAYNKETWHDLMGCYLKYDIEESDAAYESKRIMECRLNIKDKGMTKGEIYALYCPNLVDIYSYIILTNL